MLKKLFSFIQSHCRIATVASPRILLVAIGLLCVLLCFTLCSCRTSHKLTRDAETSVSTSEQKATSKVQTTSSLDSSLWSMLLHIDSAVFEYQSPVYPTVTLQHMLAMGASDSTLSGVSDSIPPPYLVNGGLSLCKIRLSGLNLKSESTNVRNSDSSVHDTVTLVAERDSSVQVKEKDKSSRTDLTFFCLAAFLVIAVLLSAFIIYVAIKIRRQ